METLTISQSKGNATVSIPMVDNEVNLSESGMDVIDSKDIVTDNRGDAKMDTTKFSGKQSISSNKNKGWRNKYGETYLHIACKFLWCIVIWILFIV